jgi:hypothetical protein
MGPIGRQGVTGAQGLKGDTGEKGGQGIQGLQGEVGPVGAQGPQGLQGDQGIQGLQGEVGPIGPQGPTGETGMAAMAAIYSRNGGTPGGSSANWTTTSGTSYASMSVTATTEAGSSGNAVVTISGDMLSNRCILTFVGTGQTLTQAATDRYAMRTGVAGPTTQVFVLPHGVTQGSNVTYTLYFRSNSSATNNACTVNEVSLVVMAP